MFQQRFFKNLSGNVVKGDQIRLVHVGNVGSSASIKNGSNSYSTTRSAGPYFIYDGNRVEIRFVNHPLPGDGWALQKSGFGNVTIVNDVNPYNRVYIDGVLQQGPPTYLEELAKLDQYSKAQYIPL